MDVITTRLANLKSLVARLKRQGQRTQAVVALELDLSASFLSQLIGGKKMGDDVARKIESAQALPHGWMDMPHPGSAYADSEQGSFGVGEAPSTYLISHALRIDSETIAAALKLVRLAFLNLNLEIDQEVNGEPLSFAYQYLIEREEREVTGENVVDFSARLQKRLQELGNVAASKDEFGDVGRGDREHRQGSKTG